MEALTPAHLALILLAFMALFGYKRMPDAARSIGRSLRIFRSELRGAAEDAAVAARPGPAAEPGATDR